VLELAPAGLAVSIITYGELYEGAAFARDPEPALSGLRHFLKGKAILPLTQPIMECFAHIRGSLPRPVRQQIGDLDMLIAATCLAHNLTLTLSSINPTNEHYKIRSLLGLPALAITEIEIKFPKAYKNRHFTRGFPVSPCMFDGGPIFMEHGPVSWQAALPLVHQDRGAAWVASPSPWRARTVAWA
jgi:predicted nucleic acid-binding protein